MTSCWLRAVLAIVVAAVIGASGLRAEIAASIEYVVVERPPGDVDQSPSRLLREAWYRQDPLVVNSLGMPVVGFMSGFAPGDSVSRRHRLYSFDEGSWKTNTRR